MRTFGLILAAIGLLMNLAYCLHWLREHAGEWLKDIDDLERD